MKLSDESLDFNNNNKKIKMRYRKINQHNLIRLG